MLGVTAYMTTDIAAIPMLWVIPLGLYLLSFIVTFARRPVLPHAWMVRALPMAAVLLTLILSISSVAQPIVLPVHLAAFFLAAMVCHGELVRRRPTQEHLTAFYLALSCGGVLGGVFNALLAPLLFDRIAEYPLALVLACLVLPQARADREERSRWFLDAAVALGVGLLALGLARWTQGPSASTRDGLSARLAFGLPAMLCYAFKDRPPRFALGLGAVLLAAGVSPGTSGLVLFQERNYFGVVRVTRDQDGRFHRLIHGHTLHGQQALDPARRSEPLTYYHRTGPVGQVFETLQTRQTGLNVALVGLVRGLWPPMAGLVIA